MDFSYGFGAAVLSPGKTSTVELLLTFQCDYLRARGAQRRPLSLSVVIDRSGSMSGKPLQAATRAAGMLLRQLSPHDTVSVVTYESRVETLIEPTLATDPEALARSLSKIRVGGATALHGGWQRGCELVQARPASESVQRVVLLTDGLANVGVTEPSEIISQTAARRAQGVATSTLGFGRDFDEDLLIGMADAGGGNFYYIESPDEAAQLFLIEAESLTAVGAQNLEVTVRPCRGVVIEELIDVRGLSRREDGTAVLSLGDVYGGEDRTVGLVLTVTAPEKEGFFEMCEVTYGYDPVSESRSRGEITQTTLVMGISGRESAQADPVVTRALRQLRVARAKGRAVALDVSGQRHEAAVVLRKEANTLGERDGEESYEVAEERAQLEYFAERIDEGALDGGTRKLLKDQAFQGRSRSRVELGARGAGGGSAAGLAEVSEVGRGVLLVCEREGGKLRVTARGEGVDATVPVLIPRAVRQEGVRYVAEGLESRAKGTYYTVNGALKRLAPSVVTEGTAGRSAHGLEALFEGGGESWWPVLQRVLEGNRGVEDFLGVDRDPNIVPVRELTFQALKPNPPERWKVVIFGQNPYPRVESATGIAMFDNTFNHWKDSQFGKVTSIRCIIKAAVMRKYGVPKATPIAALRALLAKENTVQPPEWFQAMLTQGVLLLNASLTASADSARGDVGTQARHAAFWWPVIEKIVEEILRAKQASEDPRHKAVVFAWWGAQAKSLKAMVTRVAKAFSGVKVRHVDHANPAAQGDIFCDGDPFGAIDAGLGSVGLEPVDWLPSAGWNGGGSGVNASAEAKRMGAFIEKTIELHKVYLERLQEVGEEPEEKLEAITGVRSLARPSFESALASLVNTVSGVEPVAESALSFAKRKLSGLGATPGALDESEAAAVYLYTTDSGFYRAVNAALRDPDRSRVEPFKGYLCLLLGALEKLEVYTGTVWRGVALDLRKKYPVGRRVTWWGVSSCTAKLSVAHGFLGTKGKRTLFSVKPRRAVGVRAYSAFGGEEEFLLAPGAVLEVVKVTSDKGGLCTIELEEVSDAKGVQ